MRVAVLSGGRSSEHEVSLASAKAVIGALDSDRYDVISVVIDRAGRWSVEEAPVALVPDDEGRGVLVWLADGRAVPLDVVFPALHGPFGEDGTVQGLCEIAGVAYVGAGVAASAVAMDKALCKVVLDRAGVPTAVGTVVTGSEWRDRPKLARERVGDLVGYPAFCKPARLGSSVGISPVPTPEDLDGALDCALAHDSKALVERAIVGSEVEVGILGNEELVVSPAGELTYDSEWYDYETKYVAGRMRLIVPARVDQATADRVRELAERSFRAIGAAGMARVDFFASAADGVLVSEVNTIPGFTPTSVYASLLAAGGVSYGAVVDRLVQLASARFRAAARLRH